MAHAAPIITAIIAVASTAYSIHTQQQAADEARGIAKKNAAKAASEAEEAANRARKNADRAESLARAKAGASGVRGASTDIYLNELEKANADQISWIRKAGASNADIALSEGSLAGAHATAGMINTANTGASQVYNTGQTAGWWN